MVWSIFLLVFNITLISCQFIQQRTRPELECPAGMVVLPENEDGGKCIDKYEAAVEFYDNPSNSWKPHPFNFPLDDLVIQGIQFRAVDSSGVFPQAYVCQEHAKAACTNAEKRLCKIHEWLAGCQGKSEFVFPYGNEYRKFACNSGYENPVIRIFGPHPSWSHKEMNDPRLVMLNQTLEIGGMYPQCCGEVGTCDQDGNLDEWIDMETPEGHGVFKGGYFVDDLINGPGCLYKTTAHFPTYHDYSLGFRCCI